MKRIGHAGMERLGRPLAIASIAVAGLGGCTPRATARETDAAAQPARAASSRGSSERPEPTAGVADDDDGIVAVVRAENRAALEAARLALGTSDAGARAASAAVVTFATAVMTDRAESEALLDVVAQSMGMSASSGDAALELEAAAPFPSAGASDASPSAADASSAEVMAAIRRAIDVDAARVAALLAPVAGKAFDAAYADSQARRERSWLALVRDRLVPAARNVQLRAFLETTEATAATHLEMAEALLRSAGAPAAPPAAPAGDGSDGRAPADER